MSDTLTANVDGHPVLIEIAETPPARTTRGFGLEPSASSAQKAAGKVVDALESAKDTVLSIARKMVTAVRHTDQAITPDEFELEFNLKFNAEGQAIIARVSGEASLRIKLTYRHKYTGEDSAQYGLK